MTTEHEHHWLDDLRKYRWCMECLYKEIRLDIGCEIWVPVLYGDALFDLQVDLSYSQQQVAALEARLVVVTADAARYLALLVEYMAANKNLDETGPALRRDWDNEELRKADAAACARANAAFEAIRDGVANHESLNPKPSVPSTGGEE